MNMHYLILALAVIFPLASSQTEYFSIFTENGVNQTENLLNSSNNILEKLDRYLLQNRATFNIRSADGVVRSCPTVYKRFMVHGGSPFTVSIVNSESVCLNISKLIVATDYLVSSAIKIILKTIA